MASVEIRMSGAIVMMKWIRGRLRRQVKWRRAAESIRANGG